MFGANYFSQIYFGQAYPVVVATPITVVFRKTLSLVGTRTGSRQTQGN
jgi:hypothetical protein